MTCPKSQRAGFQLAALDSRAAPECPPGPASSLFASRRSCRYTTSDSRRCEAAHRFFVAFALTILKGTRMHLEFLASLGIIQKNGHPAHPQTQGKINVRDPHEFRHCVSAFHGALRQHCGKVDQHESRNVARAMRSDSRITL